MKSSKNRGFTLIELLLVIGIIIILASLVIVNVSKARAKGRDSKRVADLSTIQLAMEMYKDSHGAYPSCAVSTPPACSGTNVVTQNTWFGLHTILNGTNFTTAIQGYLTPVPKDPAYSQNIDNDYQILIKSDQSQYWIVAKLENAADNAPSDSVTGKCYKVLGATTGPPTDALPANATLPGYPTLCNP